MKLADFGASKRLGHESLMSGLKVRGREGGRKGGRDGGKGLARERRGRREGKTQAWVEGKDLRDRNGKG
jgi:hypothetical protein